MCVMVVQWWCGGGDNGGDDGGDNGGDDGGGGGECVCVCVCVCAGVTPLVGEAGRTAAIETRLSTVHVCV